MRRRHRADVVIVRPKPSFFDLLFALRGSIVPVVAPRVAFIALLATGVAFYVRTHPTSAVASFTVAPFTVIGLALSVFLSFRNSACFERWWEARKHWGQLIWEARSLARELQGLLPDEADRERRSFILRHASAFAYALAARLRGADEIAATARILPEHERRTFADRSNVTDAILVVMTTELTRCVRDGRLTDVLYATVAQRINAMAGVQAACERIRNTPLPFAYSLLLHRTAYLFCLLLPFGLVGAVGLVTPLVAAVVAYTFFGLDALGDELEEPFGLSANDLPIDALARIVEIDLSDAMGVAPPPPLEPVDFVLR
nr:bestrophin family protein [Labilithrix luteola]